jgi:hypothetical protein
VSVILDIPSMRADLRDFGRAAKLFIKNHQRLAELEKQLVNAAAHAKATNRDLKWSTDVGTGGPICTEQSAHYRNEGAITKRMIAEVSFEFSGTLDAADDNRLVIQSGGTRVKLCWDDGGGVTLYHFDIQPQAVGHPMLHVQFNGPINGVPRLHSFFAHPLDVLEFTLMEVFQGEWRRSRVDSRFVSQIRKFPENQRKRIVALFSCYRGWVDSADPALISLLKSPSAPLDLYPN